MRRFFPIALAAFPFLTTAQQPVPAEKPDAQATLNYIHATWDTLTRSATDCSAFKDVKLDGVAQPVLYVPAGIAVPAEAASLERTCKVRVERLPRRIEQLGDILPGELKAQGLLYLPHPYIVPGGRFNEMYGWDSYFIVLGLEADHKETLARGIVENFLFEAEHYGAVLNANRTYYLTRSQPPFLTSMIRAVYENPASFPRTPQGRMEAHAWLQRAYSLAQKDYATWMRPEHKAGTTGLQRYYDFGAGPVPEEADDSSYYTDAIRWLLAHPQESAGLLVKASEHPDTAETMRLKAASCDVHASIACMRAWYGGYRLSSAFFASDRAMRESGFDPSNRFGPFSANTLHYAPVCLNSLLYRYERDLQHMALLLGDAREAARWEKRATARAAAMRRYLWRTKEGVFADYDFLHAKTSDYAFITSLFPLWAGLATREEAEQMVARLNLFERPGGLSTSNTVSGLQWDEPFGWAPTNWIVVAGLESLGFRKEAARIAEHFCATVDAGFAVDGTIREKYNVTASNADVRVSAGYKTNEIGFGWTNAVYLKLRELLQRRGAMPAN